MAIEQYPLYLAVDVTVSEIDDFPSYDHSGSCVTSVYFGNYFSIKFIYLH